jgi:hypothetical protein
MVDVIMGRVAILLALAGCILVVLGGCGDSSSAANETSSERTTTAAGHGGDTSVLGIRRRLLRKTVGELEDRGRVCKIMSDRFLSDNYGAPGEVGRHRCERAVHRHKPNKNRRLESYRILKCGLKSARVRIVETTGTRVVIGFVFLHGRWLIDSAMSPDNED